MQKDTFIALVNKFLAGKASAAEQTLIETYLERLGADEITELPADLSAKASHIWEKIQLSMQERSTPVVHRVHFLKTSWFRYAAAIIILIGAAAIWYTQSAESDQSGKSVVQTVVDIEPGTNRAILTVGNNRITLASNKTGINVGNTITYNDGERIADGGELLQLVTPKGGQYQAVLPDGSKVWLNAASSIRFPSKFIGDKREIEVNGEVYIEVARNSQQPFYVTTRKTSIQVLGTSFNVNAYEDEESEKTTLIDGSVRVVVNSTLTTKNSTLLKPGQQAKLLNDELSVVNNQADVAIAWKNGIFNFEGSDLRSVMRQLERWYNIKVQYQGSVSNIVFKGKMYRNVSFSDVLEMLQKMGVKSRMEGNILIVL